MRMMPGLRQGRLQWDSKDNAEITKTQGPYDELKGAEVDGPQFFRGKQIVHRRKLDESGILTNGRNGDALGGAQWAELSYNSNKPAS